MNRGRATLLLLGAAFFFGGCAVQGRPFAKAVVPADRSVIYVYRPYHYGSSALRPPVTCGDETARIGPGGYHAFIVPTEKVVCRVQTDSADEIQLDAQPRVHYLREEFSWSGTLSEGQPRLNPIDTDAAQTEIQSCCVQEETPAENSESLPPN
jgi:hypothetical protein